MAVAVASWRAFPRFSSAGQNLTLGRADPRAAGHLVRIYQAMRSYGLKGRLRMSVGVLVFEASEQL